MWPEAVGEYPGIPLPLLSRLTSRSARTREGRNYQRRAAALMESAKHSKVSNREVHLVHPPGLPNRIPVAVELDFQVLLPSILSGLQSVPHNRSFLELLEQGEPRN